MNRPRPFYKNNRLILFLLTLFLLFSALLYLLFLRRQLLPGWLVTHKMMLFSLWYVDVTLLIIFAFVMIRYIVKLFMERRSKAYAAKLRTRIALSLAGMTLVPIIYLFVIALDIIVHANPQPANVTQLAHASRRVIDSFTEQEEATLRKICSDLITTFKRRPMKSWPGITHRTIAGGRVQMVEVYIERRPLFSQVTLPFDNRNTLRESSGYLKEIMQYGEAVKIGKVGNIWVLKVGLAFTMDEKPIQVVAARRFPATLGEDRAIILNTDLSTRQVTLEHTALTATRILIFLLITLGVTLASIWYGSYISHQLTRPLKELSIATEKIAGGNLEVLLEEDPSHEWRTFIKTFNHMVAEIHRVRSLLVQERSKLETILHSTPVGIVYLDDEGTVSQINPSARSIFNSAQETADQNDLPEILLPMIDEAKRGGEEPLRRNLSVRGMRWEVAILPIPMGGTLIVVEDITQLVQAQQVATWQKAARQIAHELKNPLTPIKLSTERLLYRARREEVSPEMMAQTCETILSEVDHLKKMVDSFVRFARIPTPVKEAVDLHAFVEETVRLYRNVEKEIRITSEIPSGLKVHADPHLLKQVLTNILDNAFEASDPGSRVTITSRQEGEQVVIEVSDEGRGIPDEKKGEIFQPYTSTKGRGSGLGLSIVNRIMRDHGGTIIVLDNHPSGTTFRLSFPMVDFSSRD